MGNSKDVLYYSLLDPMGWLEQVLDDKNIDGELRELLLMEGL